MLFTIFLAWILGEKCSNLSCIAGDTGSQLTANAREEIRFDNLLQDCCVPTTVSYDLWYRIPKIMQIRKDNVFFETNGFRARLERMSLSKTCYQVSARVKNCFNYMMFVNLMQKVVQVIITRYGMSKARFTSWLHEFAEEKLSRSHTMLGINYDPHYIKSHVRFPMLWNHFWMSLAPIATMEINLFKLIKPSINIM